MIVVLGCLPCLLPSALVAARQPRTECSRVRAARYSRSARSRSAGSSPRARWATGAPSTCTTRSAARPRWPRRASRRSRSPWRRAASRATASSSRFGAAPAAPCSERRRGDRARRRAPRRHARGRSRRLRARRARGRERHPDPLQRGRARAGRGAGHGPRGRRDDRLLRVPRRPAGDRDRRGRPGLRVALGIVSAALRPIALGAGLVRPERAAAVSVRAPTD